MSGLAAVVMAAGRGKRMKSPLAKVLHRVHGLPLLEYPLRALAEAGASPMAIVVGHQADQVQAAFAGRGLWFVTQDPPLGTGHAVMAARLWFEASGASDLMVVNGDLPHLRASSLKRLLEVHRASRAVASLLSVRLPDGGAYGRVLRQGERVLGIVEAKDATADQLRIGEVNVGVYVFQVPSLVEALSALTPQNAQGEYYLTDVVAGLAHRGQSVEAVVAEDADEGLGVNTLAELADATRTRRLARLQALMADGVVIEDPATCDVGEDAVVEATAWLRPFTLVEGRSRVGAGAVVGPYVRLESAVVGARAQILDHCLLRECEVHEQASIGPFAHIRPESVIERGAKVGNFVELKKTRLGEGAKAPHLSYLGDATIGARANIGAGTITCNYDGQAKHPTRIGEGAFVGSHATLVAPVEIGNGAYVGAGSVITKSVPEDALAVGRAQQVVKEGWARRRRETGHKPQH